ncbi:MAG: hypothetical protein U0V73_00345 [Acidimicrobiia bacterium]
MRCPNCSTLVADRDQECWLCRAHLAPATSAFSTPTAAAGAPTAAVTPPAPTATATLAPPVLADAVGLPSFDGAPDHWHAPTGSPAAGYGNTPPVGPWPPTGARSSKPRRARRGRVAGALGVLAILAVKIGLGVYFSMPDATQVREASAFAAGQRAGVAYTSAAGRFSATFPARPVETDRTHALEAGGTLTVHWVDSGSDDHYFGVHYVDYPGASDFAMRGVVNDWRAPADTTDVTAGGTTYQGAPARELTWRFHGRTLRELTVSSGTRVYFVRVGTSDDTDGGYARFRDSFRVTG